MFGVIIGSDIASGKLFGEFQQFLCEAKRILTDNGLLFVAMLKTNTEDESTLKDSYVSKPRVLEKGIFQRMITSAHVLGFESKETHKQKVIENQNIFPNNRFCSINNFTVLNLRKDEKESSS